MKNKQKYKKHSGWKQKSLNFRFLHEQSPSLRFTVQNIEIRFCGNVEEKESAILAAYLFSFIM